MTATWQMRILALATMNTRQWIQNIRKWLKLDSICMVFFKNSNTLLTLLEMQCPHDFFFKRKLHGAVRKRLAAEALKSTCQTPGSSDDTLCREHMDRFEPSVMMGHLSLLWFRNWTCTVCICRQVGPQSLRRRRQSFSVGPSV